jgi:thioredoxin reductase (NADPH)
MALALGPLAAELGFTVDTVDVDSSPTLEARYGDKVPVLVDAGGEEICHYVLDPDALRDRVAVK